MPLKKLNKTERKKRDAFFDLATELKKKAVGYESAEYLELVTLGQFPRAWKK